MRKMKPKRRMSDFWVDERGGHPVHEHVANREFAVGDVVVSESMLRVLRDGSLMFEVDAIRAAMKSDGINTEFHSGGLTVTHIEGAEA